MTSKTILVLAIAAAFVAGTLTTGTLVFAAEDSFKDRCENKLDKDNFNGHVCRALLDLQDQIDTIELTPGPQGDKGDTGEQGPPGQDATVGLNLKPIAGRNIEIDVTVDGTNFLFYGPELCQVDWRGTTAVTIAYIEFATTTTVLDQGACGSPSKAINLFGGDAVFQPGDFLILQSVIEVYRQQTIP